MSNKKLFFLTLIFIAAITVIVPIFSQAKNIGWWRPDSKAHDSSVGKDTRASDAQDEPQVLAFEVTPSGVNPSETIVHQGKSLILLRNLTGIRDLNFWLARENEKPVSESKGQTRDWKTQMRLSPGTYILGETNHPEWKSIIRVTN